MPGNTFRSIRRGDLSAPLDRVDWIVADLGFGVRGHVRALETGDMSPVVESGVVPPHSKFAM
ncbi:MAG: hypothetical protein PHD76_08255 [Methylacidiphilales bacterium]|nr:hypothetical protein [Candidatus Methylacidiphilales bacterium]